MSALVAGCSGSGGSSSTLPGASGSGSSTLSVAMMDAPFRMGGGTVTAVNVDIAKVEAVGASGGKQTIATFSPSQRVNLLDLQTSPLTLGTAQIPAGTYSQLRLVLDTSAATNNNIVIDGTTYPLTIPSATGPSGFNGSTSTDSGDGPGTAGIKVNVSLDAQPGQAYGFLIDFNAAESIVSAGASGQFLMKPVLVATAQALAGAISGTVKNSAGTGVSGAQVVAEQNGTIVNTSVTDASGHFQINALPAGSYTLVVNNVWTNQAGTQMTATGYDGTATSVTDPNSVTVTGGQTTSGIVITD